MKILWFTNTTSCYQDKLSGYNGGGWISSLEQELKKREDVELAVCFYTTNENVIRKDLWNGTIYYMIPRPKKSFLYIWNTFCGNFDKSSSMQEDLAIPSLLKVVKDFNPDIIQVFGSENIYALIAKYVKIPLVLHIQGLLSPCLNAFLPPFISWKNYLHQARTVKGFLYFFSEKLSWQRNSFTERRMLKDVKYFMGRTEWDKRIIQLLSPHAKYYYCSEILRNIFYCSKVQRVLPQSPIFVTTISSQLYKGFDLILKTARILKNIGFPTFRWIVFGDINPILVEQTFGFKHDEVNVDLLGVVSEDIIKDTLLKSTAYVHTSYIDNSPNSLCEAAMLGVTTISTNVGGISSLIEDGYTGFLVPANDPYQLAYLMKYLYENFEININVGNNARKVAVNRHNRRSIVERVLEIYNDILENEQNIKNIDPFP